jgi:hypothetical protein
MPAGGARGLSRVSPSDVTGFTPVTALPSNPRWVPGSLWAARPNAGDPAARGLGGLTRRAAGCGGIAVRALGVGDAGGADDGGLGAEVRGRVQLSALNV